MTREELQTRIDKKNKDIEKINKRIAKWESMKDEEHFIKDKASWYSRTPKLIKTMSDLIEARYTCVEIRYEDKTREDSKKFLEQDYESFIYNCNEEIRRAKSDLEDALATASKYQTQLDKLVNYENEEKIEVIWNFLMSWKQRATEFFKMNAETYFNLKKNYHTALEEFKKTHENATYWQKNEFERDYWSNVEKLTRDITHIKCEYFYKDKKNHPFDYEYLPVSYTVDEALLEKELDKDVRKKYENLINQITHITGTITDASCLRIGAKGDINGIVSGEKGKAKVQTFGAGGYNVQCWHYRTRVDRVE